MEARRQTLGRDLGRLALLLISSDVAASIMNLGSWHSGGITILWPTNALLTAYLLCAPRSWKRIAAYLALAFCIDFAENFALSWPVGSSLYFAACNTLEVLLAWMLISRVTGPRPDLTKWRHFAAMVVFGMGVASIAASLASSVVFASGLSWTSMDRLITIRNWYLADVLGMATVLPPYLSYRLRTGVRRYSRTEAAGLFLLLVAVSIAVFAQQHYPVLFALTPLLLLLGVRMGLTGSALGLLTVTVISGAFTSHGRGPTALIPDATLAHRDLFLQCFIALNMFTLYLVDVVVANSQRLQQDLKINEARFRLLAESSRDIIILSNLKGMRDYVSPAIVELLGWTPEELVGRSYREYIHQDDLERFDEKLDDLRAGRPIRSITYRQLAKNGSHHWMESNPRLLLDPATGEATGYVTVVRDITDRKRAEEELARAFSLVEELASIDGLTGLANRRRFDEALEREWHRAVRDASEIAILMLDVDHFKRYNDTYGHLSGDECLRKVAGAIRQSANRATDLAARYGGEEFAVILPGTGYEGAIDVCTEILKAVRLCGITHSDNPTGVATLSAGCAVTRATTEGNYYSLLRAADSALYEAKANGRNQLKMAGSIEIA
ncbi:diguanylate cyclase [Silvibacterium sp.]|uniref:sensor domain-containing diguanylate cyclase n=1 Tax=Silvibacterium sp. TaxID=1964179 RepID=UPI0039E3B066